MHARNGHAPYRDVADALAHWPETATAIAARLGPAGVEILAPHGLADLFALLARPTPAHRTDPAAMLARMAVAGANETRGWTRLMALEAQVERLVAQGEFEAALTKAGQGKSITVLVRRGEFAQYVVIRPAAR